MKRMHNLPPAVDKFVRYNSWVKFARKLEAELREHEEFGMYAESRTYSGHDAFLNTWRRIPLDNSIDEETTGRLIAWVKSKLPFEYLHERETEPGGIRIECDRTFVENHPMLHLAVRLE